MIANPSKVHAIIIRRDRKDTEGEVRKTESEVPMLGITLNSRLTFDINIGNICKRLQIKRSKKTCMLLKLHAEKNISLVFHYIEF